MEHLSKRAADVIDTVDVIAGYGTYLDLIRPLIKEKEIISSGMTKEIDRVKQAIETALSGKSCALVSSGDPGIYAMAGLAFEICKKMGISIIRAEREKREINGKPALPLSIIPGIPALCSGASLLGAPLTHDFAVISLSDLLTPWEIIEKRLESAAQADFVIVLYNPKSKRRSENLNKAQEIILKYRPGSTPVGIVVGAMRKNQDVKIVQLEDLHTAYVDMQTTLFIGSTMSCQYSDFMFTPRGYSGKYSME